MTGKRVKTLRKKLPNSETAQLGERGKKLGQPLLIFRAGVNYVTAFSLSHCSFCQALLPRQLEEKPDT